MAPHQPTTPAADLAARRAHADPVLAGGVLTPELAALAQGGVSVTLGVVDRCGWPLAGIGLACRIDGDGEVRLLLDADACAPLIAAVRQGSPVAATFSRPFDHRSFQVKARRATCLEAAPGDTAYAEQRLDALRGDLIGLGFDPALAAGYVGAYPGRLAIIAFLPEAAFVQTPGPGAGSRLSP